MKAVFRNFRVTYRRFQLAAGLNVLGLSVAFAAFIVILIQVRHERTFDRAYPLTGHIFRVESTLVPAESDLSARESYAAFCARPLMEMMLPAVPQVVASCTMYGGSSEMYVNYETQDGQRRGIRIPLRRVSAGFGDVFAPEMLEGSAGCLAEPGKVLLPQSLAGRMFGEGPFVDRQIRQPDGYSFTVGGVYRDFPANTSMENDVKIGLGDDFANDWMDWALLHFVVLAPEVSAGEAGGQLTAFFNQPEGPGKMMGYTEDVLFRLNRLEDIYYSQDTNLDIAPKGNRLMTNLLLSIAFLVIAIATVNFLNFSTALTPVRIKSIHIQKLLGASTGALRFALLLEVVVLCVLSFVLALGWVYLFDLAGLSSIMLAAVDLFQNKEVLIFTFLLAVVVGVTGGFYPAFYMTASVPKARVGMLLSGRKLRIGLTVFQFTISSGLIIAASFLWLQNHYMQNLDGVINDGRIATITLDNKLMDKSSEVLLEELKSDPAIVDVALSDWPVGFLEYYPYNYAKSAEDEQVRYYCLPVSYNFTELMELELISGRHFTKGDVEAQEERLILNELAAKQFHLQPGDRLVNAQMAVGLVVGIVKDFHFMNLRKKIEPMAFTTKSVPTIELQPTLYVRTTGDAHRAVEQIRAGIAKVDAQYPVDVKFYDQQFEAAYQKERNTSVQIALFGLLAVVISLMGVFGLVTFETQYRRKEISLRKVMGATVSEVLILFNKKFTVMVLAGFILAAPIAWFGVERWLQSFAYRTPIYEWVFLLSLLIVLVMTCLTVTLQCWRVALINPAEALKSE